MGEFDIVNFFNQVDDEKEWLISGKLEVVTDKAWATWTIYIGLRRSC